MKSSDWNPYPQRKPLQHKQFLLWVRRPRFQWPSFEIGYWDGEKFLAIRDKYVLAWAHIPEPPPLRPLAEECKVAAGAPRCARKF